jgi:hypothetical protein
MSTVTPNFNWPVPTSTDLVRDGATAIEALGDSIDASLVDLKGGTTGQVLSKTSGTDMDFTWVTSDDANAIQNTIVDAKGDLITATAADTPARLAVGATNNTVLTVDSSTATGLKYSADWTTYTPSWTAAGTAPAIGNGTLSGKYLQVGKNVIVQIVFVAGSTTTFGTNEWRFSLPFASYELSGSAAGHPASGYVEDAAVAAYQVLASRKSGGASNVAFFYTSNLSLQSTQPFTWANGDFFNIELVYGIA